MNTYASQHPADKTPLYEPVHATVGCECCLKRVLLGEQRLTLWLGGKAFSQNSTPPAPE